MITLEGPQGIVDKSSKKILARGRAPPPFLAMPGFWVHMVPQLIPKFETFSEIKVCHQSLDPKGILAQCFSEIIMVNMNIIMTFFSSFKVTSPAASLLLTRLLYTSSSTSFLKHYK